MPVPEDAPVLLLSHDPDAFPAVPARVSLTLAGHTHGGQVAIPGLRRPFVPSRYGERYVHGHMVEGGRHLYVSSGVGTSGAAAALPAPARGGQPDAARAQLSSVSTCSSVIPTAGFVPIEQRRAGAPGRPRLAVSSWLSSIHATGRSRPGVGLDRRELPVRVVRGLLRERQMAPARGQPEQVGEVLVGPLLPARAPDALESRVQPLQAGPGGRPRCSAAARPRMSAGPREVRFDRSRKGR